MRDAHGGATARVSSIVVVTRISVVIRSTPARALHFAAGVALLAGCAGASGSASTPPARPPKAPQAIVLRVAERRFASIPLGRVSDGGRLDRTALHRVLRRTLPRIVHVRIGRGRYVLGVDRGAVERGIVARGRVAQAVEVPVQRLAATLPTPVVRQLLHNDCESAALQALLATQGVRASQLGLQSELPRSGPLDPVRRGGKTIWGDPELGFVGRANGGGPSGGFGAYTRPVAAVARRHGVRLADLTGRGARALYEAVLAGRPVLAWVGLTDGPYGSWTSPAGTPIRVNFGEHAVVLAGVRRDGALLVMNPLTGRREQWTRADFETKWARLGRRALAPRA